MSIARLIAAAPPPERPGEPFLGPWEPLERELQTALPPDYKDFVRLYGHCYFMQFLSVNLPRSRNPNVRLEHQASRVCKVMREVGEVPYPLWPEKGGLLPFGGTDNGDELCWLMRGEPRDWTIAIHDHDNAGIELIACDLTDFLSGLATGTLRPESFPDLLPWDPPFFVSSLDPPFTVQASWRMGSFGRAGRSPMARREQF
ncbi:MAG: SMI1/KNR4 family protein [Phenylobacterium sp.]|uniref:SMI1/KNR4 family protein n=1 Tax=Phenylobacterium sp. TaxID=1871053 RepID=UPI001A482898|nr:SMI1/KNR4 family protein [Phenylobacterium sp.]MBL8773067.1 SMI1/KNR4 family protein [Phenylobacterium sp.]